MCFTICNRSLVAYKRAFAAWAPLTMWSISEALQCQVTELPAHVGAPKRFMRPLWMRARPRLCFAQSGAKTFK